MFSILLGSDGGLVQARIFSFLDIVRSDISFPILLFLISRNSAAALHIQSILYSDIRLHFCY